MRKLAAVAALTLGVSLTLSACGSDDPTRASSTASTTDHNDADVTFATEMVQHHAQALSMVDLTMGRELAPEVQTLAEDIRAAQAPEIESMTDWLTAWGEDVPETVRDHANAGHDMEGMDDGDMGQAEVPGMMSADDMATLADASDEDFQDLWLEMMVEHHQGAIQMAETEEADGQYAPAVELARNIQESQTAEIEKMQALLS